jgi:hypothetical protein
MPRLRDCTVPKSSLIEFTVGHKSSLCQATNKVFFFMFTVQMVGCTQKSSGSLGNLYSTKQVLFHSYLTLELVFSS